MKLSNILKVGKSCWKLFKNCLKSLSTQCMGFLFLWPCPRGRLRNRRDNLVSLGSLLRNTSRIVYCPSLINLILGWLQGKEGKVNDQFAPWVSSSLERGIFTSIIIPEETNHRCLTKILGKNIALRVWWPNRYNSDIVPCLPYGTELQFPFPLQRICREESYLIFVTDTTDMSV